MANDTVVVHVEFLDHLTDEELGDFLEAEDREFGVQDRIDAELAARADEGRRLLKEDDHEFRELVGRAVMDGDLDARTALIKQFGVARWDELTADDLTRTEYVAQLPPVVERYANGDASRAEVERYWAACDSLSKVNDLLDLVGEQRLVAFRVERGDEPVFVFVGHKGEARITAKQLVEWRYAMPALMIATGAVLDAIERHRWLHIVRELHECAEVVEMSEDERSGDRARGWVRDYLSERGDPLEDVDEAHSREEPFKREGATWIDGRRLQTWIEFHRRSDRVTSSDFGRAMRGAGFRHERVHVTKESTGKRTTISAWCVDTGVMDIGHTRGGVSE
jgi:hypothetical protein